LAKLQGLIRKNIMKKFAMIAAVLYLAACGNTNNNIQTSTATDSSATNGTEAYFGAKITADSAMPIAELTTAMGEQTSLNVKLEAPVEAVCQKKGCWMDLKTADGSMRVTFKDYGFFVPKDATGKTAIVEGVAKVEETSIADLKEYAKDAGKTQAEIDAIDAPKKELVFEASGVILK
jgi:hypothetical protein